MPSNMSLIKSLYPGDKYEVWRNVAELKKAEFNPGSIMQLPQLSYTYKGWKIKAFYTHASGTDDGTQMYYTNLVCHFRNKDKLLFRISEETLFTVIGKYFGMRDFELIDPPFDEKFLIKGNSEFKIQRFFKLRELKDLLMTQSHSVLTIRDKEYTLFGPKFPAELDILSFYYFGLIKDQDHFMDMCKIMEMVLDRLLELNHAFPPQKMDQIG